MNSHKICEHFGVCGGCSHQDKPYDVQLKRKETFVRETLKDMTAAEFLPILPSPDRFFYRNKMEFSFGDGFDKEKLNLAAGPEGSVHLGLHPKNRFSLVTPTPSCLLLSPESQKILAIVADWATGRKIPVYVRNKNAGVLRHLVIREGKNTGERLVNLVATSAATHLDDLAALFKNSGVAITTLVFTVHDGLSDIARGDFQTIVWGDGMIAERIDEITVRVYPYTFMQSNTLAAEKMIELLKTWAGVGDAVLDLYCGTGVIGLNLAGHFIQAIGVEAEPLSIESARANAHQNHVTNFTAHEGKVENLLPLFETHRGRIDVCVVDPPRAGLQPRVVESLAHSKIPSVLYVSCNPLTLARDLNGLSGNYVVQTVQPMDFFPHTDHVETAVRLAIR